MTRSLWCRRVAFALQFQGFREPARDGQYGRIRRSPDSSRLFRDHSAFESTCTDGDQVVIDFAGADARSLGRRVDRLSSRLSPGLRVNHLVALRQVAVSRCLIGVPCARSASVLVVIGPQVTWSGSEDRRCFCMVSFEPSGGAPALRRRSMTLARGDVGGSAIAMSGEFWPFASRRPAPPYPWTPPRCLRSRAR